MADNKAEYQSVPDAEKDEDPIPALVPPKGFGIRHLQTLIIFVSLTIGYSTRAQLSVSIVAMTTFEESQICCLGVDNNQNFSEVNTSPIYFNASDIISNDNMTKCICDDFEKWNVFRSYNWKKTTQELVIFSFFVGYTIMQIPMGILAQKFGGKVTIMTALGVNGILSILTPWMALMGWVAVCICRLIQGLTQAAFFPSIHTLLGKWAPLNERGRLTTYIYNGSPFGTIIGFQVAGLFAGTPALGWPTTFWFCGILSLICFFLIAWLGAASPDEHPTISDEERLYIMLSGTADANSKKLKTPWKEILSSKAVWALFVTHTGSGFGFLMILTQVPLYMSKVLGVNIKNNGLLSSLPYIAMYFSTLLFGYLSDLFTNKKIMSVINIRRVGNSTGMMISGMFLIAFVYVKDTTLAIILLVLCMSLHSGVFVGFMINQIDLSPNFGGTLMSIGNMLANLGILTVPVVVSNVVQNDTTNQYKWQTVFMITAAIQIITNIVFVVFVKTDIQPWNFTGQFEETENSTTMKEYKVNGKKADEK